MDFLYTAHVFFIGILVVITHVLGRKSNDFAFLARKILHIGAISTVAHAAFITPESGIAFFSKLILTAAIVLTIAVLKGFFEIDGRKSWGIAYFPWVLWVLLMVYPNYLETIALAFTILALSDGLSALAGRFIYLPLRFQKLNLTINGKTWVGFGVFVLSSCAVLIGYFDVFFLHENVGIKLLTIITIAFTTAMVELISKKGTDNLWLPIWVFVLLAWIDRLQLLLALFGFFIPLVVLIALYVYRKKWLSVDGLFMAIILALILLLTKVDIIPLLIFFLVGSLISKINKKSSSDIKHGKPRDMWQVLANGGLVGFLALMKGFIIDRGIMGAQEVDFTVLIIMSAALGDTLSSEIGMRWGKNPFRITTGKRVPIGLSGGISFAGLFGAFIGGMIMFLYALSCYEINLQLYLVLILAAIGGSLIDSLFGDWLQEKFELNGQLSDIGLPQERVSGIKGMNNDAINFLSLCMVVLIFWGWKLF